MYISRLRVQNWRNFTKLDVSFQETVYLIGPNASGKSNFLDIFRFIRDIVNPNGGGLQQAILSRGGLTKVRSLAARQKSNIEIDIEFKESLASEDSPADWKYFLSIKNEIAGKRRVLVDKEVVYRKNKEIFARPDKNDKNDQERLTQTYLEQVNMNKGCREIVSFFEQVLYLHLVPQLLKFGNQISSLSLESDPFGQGFLEEIAKTKPQQTQKSRLKRIEEILKKVIPYFQELRFMKDPVTGKPHLEMRYVHWRPNAGWQKEDQFSDGTLRMIALIWTLLSSNSLILLEEPELSLHKKIVEQIAGLIYKARKTRKKSGGQIIVSTHSEVLLSDTSIDGNFLILTPKEGGEATEITSPTEDQKKLLQSGVTPADILFPQTAESIGNI